MIVYERPGEQVVVMDLSLFVLVIDILFTEEQGRGLPRTDCVCVFELECLCKE